MGLCGAGAAGLREQTAEAVSPLLSVADAPCRAYKLVAAVFFSLLAPPVITPPPAALPPKRRSSRGCRNQLLVLPGRKCFFLFFLPVLEHLFFLSCSVLSFLAPVCEARAVLPTALRTIVLSFSTALLPYFIPRHHAPPSMPRGPPFWARARAAYPPARISRAYRALRASQ